MKVAFFDTKPYDREYFSLRGEGQIEWQFHEFRLNSDTAAIAQGAEGACAFVSDVLDAMCLEKLKAAGVRHIAMRCAGYNNVDLDAVRRLGLLVSRVPAYSPHAVAEHTVALLLTLNRKIHRAHNRVRELNFSLSGLVGFDLHGKTAAILGTGKIGKLTAEILRGFGMRILVFDPFPDREWAQRIQAEYACLEEVLPQADVVSLHMPLTRETEHLIKESTLEMMKPGVFLLNTSRGKLIDTGHLIEALKDGRVGGVGLDVYEEEEGVFYEDLSGRVLQDDELSRLLTFPNVLITAHQAFLTREALTQIATVTTENLLRTKRGEVLLPSTQLA